MRKLLCGSLWLGGVVLLAAQAPQSGTQFLGSWKLTAVKPSSSDRTLNAGVAPLAPWAKLAREGRETPKGGPPPTSNEARPRPAGALRGPQPGERKRVARRSRAGSRASQHDTLQVGAAQIVAAGTPYDGSHYRITFTPVDGQAAAVTGDSDVRTITVTRVNDHSVKLELATSKDVALDGQATVSADGRTLTVALSGPPPMAHAPPIRFELTYTRQ